MKTVFLCLGNNIFTSDLLRTRYIEYLSSRYRVIVLTPTIDAALAERRNYYQHPNVVYYRWSIAHSKLWSRMKLLRVSLINEFDYLPAMQHFYRRPNYAKNIRRRVLRTLGRPFFWLFTARFFDRVERLTATIPQQFKDLLKEYQPALLIAGTPGLNPLDAELVTFAHKLRLPTVAVDFSWDNLTLNCKHIRRTDYLFAWNSVMREEAIQIHKYHSNRVVVTGGPRFDVYFDTRPSHTDRSVFLKSKNLDPHNKTIVIATITRSYNVDQMRHLRFLIAARDEGKFVSPINFLIRLHPNNDLDKFQEFFNLPNVHVESASQNDPPDARGVMQSEMNYDDMLNLKHTLQYGDVHVNYGSTLSLEVAVFDRPIVNIGFMATHLHHEGYYNPHYLPVLKSGAVKLAASEPELIEYINFYLDNPHENSEDRTRLARQYFEFQDGLSYKRSVDSLKELL